MNRSLLIAVLLLFPVCFTFPQETDEDNSGTLYDGFLDRLVLLEERFGEEGPVTDAEMLEIRALNSELESTIFRDLYLEGNLLAFLAENEARRFGGEEITEEFLNDFLKESKREKRRERNSRSKKFWKGFTLGSAIVGAGAFNLLSYTSALSYDRYIQSEDPAEALFYQKRWELLDTTTLGALGFTALNLLVNGILQITDLF